MTNEKTKTIEEILSNYDEKILALAQYLDIDLTPDFDAYVDEEAWKRDARFDGRGHAISRYDGNEEEIKYNNTYYYIFRQN